MDAILEQMIKKSDECFMRDKYVAAIIDKQLNVLMMTTNQPYTNTINRIGKRSYHAEELCIRKVVRKFGKLNTHKYTLLIIKTGRNGTLRACAPCKNCSKLISEYRINCWVLTN